jgi:hypothetical protein
VRLVDGQVGRVKEIPGDEPENVLK